MDLGKIIHMSKHPKREKSKIFFLAKKKRKKKKKTRSYGSQKDHQKLNNKPDTIIEKVE
jgi:hypothetical protein